VAALALERQLVLRAGVAAPDCRVVVPAVGEGAQLVRQPRVDRIPQVLDALVDGRETQEPLLPEVGRQAEQKFNAKTTRCAWRYGRGCGSVWRMRRNNSAYVAYSPRQGDARNLWKVTS
jgi:hypothetical protein